LMPVGAILIAVFVGWYVRPQVLDEELHFGSRLVFRIWLWTIRIVAPLAVLAILVSGLLPR